VPSSIDMLHTLRRAAAAATAALTAGVLGATLVVAGPASAAPSDAAKRPHRTPEVQLEIPVPDVDAGTSFEVKVKSKRVGKAKVLLQRRPAGTRDWAKAARLGKRGTFSAPGVGIGTYSYRLVVKRHGKILAHSRTRQLRSYGNLSLQTLCSSPGATITSCVDGTAIVGGASFAYHARADNTGTTSSVLPSAVFANSSCRSVALRYAVDNASGATAANVSLTQDKGGTPQTSTVALGTVGTAMFKNGSKGWNLRFWTTPIAVPVYWDATFSCFTSNGVRKTK
jgi:hypothetical protein